MAKDADRPFATVDILSPEERNLLLETWNDTHAEYQDHLCLHHLFEQQVACTPEAIAVVYKDQSLSYAELNNRANCLAHKLVELGVQPDSLVAICVERSPAMIIGMLAVLKAGGAYVPLDPSFASERLGDTLRDASPVCLVADRSGRAAIGNDTLRTLSVVDPNSNKALNCSSNVQVPYLTSRHLAYVIYTSGTTGKPKGVMVEHQGVVNLVRSRQSTIGLDSRARMSQFFSFSFDGSVYEIFSALCLGATLYLLEDSTRLDRHQLWKYLDQHSITHVVLTPAVLQDCKDLSPLSTPTTFVIAGEALSAALVRTLHTMIPNCTVINEYGPTETTVAAVSWRCTKDIRNNIVPIGRPSANKRLYVFDGLGKPVPFGAVGELYIGGVGVARGYLNRPELTAERFLPDAFVDDVDARMYRTGDLVRYLPDGNLAYLGRNDHQVKIRGFRIELGEIEAHLREHHVVSEAAVITSGEGSNKRLIAYVIAMSDDQTAGSKNGAQLALTLRSHLATQLPEYMVPSAFVRMNSFPLTPNGKLDKRALPDPSDDDFAREAFEEPQGEIETALASIWTDLLHLERVSRHDSFFALGGHSLLAVRMINRVTTLGANMPLSTLFASPCLSDFADEIKRHMEQGPDLLPSIERIARSEVLPLSFAQQRLWFLAQLDGVSDVYHIPLTVRLHGHLNRDAWQLAIDDLFMRHEALRTVFVAVNGEPYVRILPTEGMV
ncbi:hypothetical protein BGX28_000867 [Mortierella sp. GBA30]|nr:hypothetical protein BGX28_000867 [Mortierella sp. GBA30]